MRWQATGTRAAHPQSLAVVSIGGGAVGWRPGESSGGAQGSWFLVVCWGLVGGSGLLLFAVLQTLDHSSCSLRDLNEDLRAGYGCVGEMTGDGQVESTSECETDYAKMEYNVYYFDDEDED